HFKIKSTEEINKAIEDNQISLSTFKASRFIKPFSREVDKWERDISHVLEVTELWLTVQRQWLYLEVNFERQRQKRNHFSENILFV
ncbi:unnamed protein product, partial [Rotaria magnacalcarata]